MDDLLNANREEIVALCRRFGVRRLSVFGSAATGRLGTQSDVDLSVEFDYGRGGSPAEQFFGLREALHALLNRPIDLVTRDSIRNRYFRRELDRTERTLYAATTTEAA